MTAPYIYLYGMIIASTSFLLQDGFLQPDAYSEIREKYRLPGGETGTCATVLASLGTNVKLDGNHIGVQVAPVIRNFYRNKPVQLDSLYFDEHYEGLEDYVIIADDVRSPMGTFAHYFANYFTTGEKRWNTPKEADIAGCMVAAIDPFFQDESTLAAEYCVKHGKPYVTIDCRYESYIHQHAAVSIISGEGIQNNYPHQTPAELFPLFQENSDGLTIITNGGKNLFYGRKGEKMRSFRPYPVNVVSTLGAGDSFKAGCVYAVSKGMNDDDLIQFASACSAVAISRFPLPLYPPTLEEITQCIQGTRK